LRVGGGKVKGGVDLRSRESFADVGATIVENFDLSPFSPGKSFLQEVAV
jgi:phosphopentomutase